MFFLTSGEAQMPIRILIANIWRLNSELIFDVPFDEMELILGAARFCAQIMPLGPFLGSVLWLTTDWNLYYSIFNSYRDNCFLYLPHNFKDSWYFLAQTGLQCTPILYIDHCWWGDKGWGGGMKQQANWLRPHSWSYKVEWLFPTHMEMDEIVHSKENCDTVTIIRGSGCSGQKNNHSELEYGCSKVAELVRVWGQWPGKPLLWTPSDLRL